MDQHGQETTESDINLEYYPDDLLEAVDVMNDLFAESLGWLDGAEGRLSEDAAERCRILVGRLVALVSHRVIPYGIGITSRHQSMMRAALRDPRLMQSLPNFPRVLELSGQRVWESALFEEANVGWNPYDESIEKLSPEEAHEIFNSFLVHEKVLLRYVGFNQNSIAVIMHYLESMSEEIVEAIRVGRGVNSWKYDRSLKSMMNASQRIIARIANGNDVMFSSRDLSLIKTKSVAVGTIVGDVMPLLLTKDFGIASLVSTIAGATVGGMLSQAR